MKRWKGWFLLLLGIIVLVSSFWYFLGTQRNCSLHTECIGSYALVCVRKKSILGRFFGIPPHFGGISHCACVRSSSKSQCQRVKNANPLGGEGYSVEIKGEFGEFIFVKSIGEVREICQNYCENQSRLYQNLTANGRYCWEPPFGVNCTDANQTN